MIIENTTNTQKRALIADIWQQIHTLHQQREALESELKQPVAWAHETNFRVKLSPDAMMKIMIEDKALFDSIYSDPNIFAEKVGTDVYVYLNFIYEPTEEHPEFPAHKTTIENAGGIIKSKVVVEPNQEI